jgi:hypothetical protein
MVSSSLRITLVLSLNIVRTELASAMSAMVTVVRADLDVSPQ